MSVLEELVFCMPLVATMALLLWPEKRYEHTPVHLRREPTLRSEP